MIAKNEYVKIQTGKKEYTLRNYMYDSYLRLFSEFQYNYREIDNIHGGDLINTCLQNCVIKFDTPLKDYKNATYGEFDIRIGTRQIEIIGNECSVSSLYNYNSNTGAYEINNLLLSDTIDLLPYNGKKITAIGFVANNRTFGYSLDRTLYACVDTSNYSILFNASRGISISRKDVMSSNAVCDGYDYPLHLSPVQKERYNQEENSSNLKSILYSVGFGNLRGKMDLEFVIGREVEIQKLNSFSYGVVMRNPTSVPLYPRFLYKTIN